MRKHRRDMCSVPLVGDPTNHLRDRFWDGRLEDTRIRVVVAVLVDTPKTLEKSRNRPRASDRRNQSNDSGIDCCHGIVKSVSTCCKLPGGWGEYSESTKDDQLEVMWRPGVETSGEQRGTSYCFRIGPVTLRMVGKQEVTLKLGPLHQKSHAWICLALIGLKA